MIRDRPFIPLFLIYFIVITAITVIVFILIGIKMTDRFFSHYVDAIHAETEQMLLAKIAMHYIMYSGWDGFSGEETGESAKITGDYFTVKDNSDNILYTSENSVEKCCANANHVYTNKEFPIYVDGARVGTLICGYFTNHISKPEEEVFRRSALFLVSVCIIAVIGAGAAVSILFFYRLARPLRLIADGAERISRGDMANPIQTDSSVREMNQITGAINSLSNSLVKQEKFRKDLTKELSHELRTPLQIMLNQVEALADGVYEISGERLDTIYAEIKRIAWLTDELENRLMLDIGDFDLKISKIDISKLIRRIVSSFQASFALKKIACSFDIEDGIIAAVDELKFTQLVYNLLSNSLKYTSSGGVTVKLSYQDSAAALSVSDTGEGIDEEEIAAVFDRFYHSDAYRSSHGVGLYLVKLIADKHGFKLEVKSRKGCGTTFLLTGIS